MLKQFHTSALFDYNTDQEKPCKNISYIFCQWYNTCIPVDASNIQIRTQKVKQDRACVNPIDYP